MKRHPSTIHHLFYSDILFTGVNTDQLGKYYTTRIRLAKIARQSGGYDTTGLLYYKNKHSRISIKKGSNYYELDPSIKMA